LINILAGYIQEHAAEWSLDLTLGLPEFKVLPRYGLAYPIVTPAGSGRLLIQFGTP